MRKSEFHTKIAAAYKLAEDSGCWEVAKCGPNAKGSYDIRRFNFQCPPEDYEFALAVVEGKAVFVGDTLYDLGGNKYDDCTELSQAQFMFASWTKPKPKIITVELMVEDVVWLDKNYQSCDWGLFARIRGACAKALKE